VATTSFDLNYEISKARTRLISRAPFFGYLALQMRPRPAKPEDDVPTAGISPDGTVVINEEFISKLKPQEVAGVLAHEVMHPALHYWGRRGSRHHLLFNIAHDLSFNFIITEMAKGEIELPDGALLDPKFQGMSAEEIYGYLLKGDPKTPGVTKIACKGGGSITVEVNGKGGEDYKDCRDDLSDSHLGQRAARGDDAAQRQLANGWKLAIAGAVQQHEARKTQGKLPAALQRFIDDLLHPKLDWQEQLQRWMGDNGRREDYSYMRPNRRSESIGSVLPSQCAGGFSDITALIDTSGSRSEDSLKRTLAEIQGICEEMGTSIRVIIVDADVHDDLTVEDAMEVAKKLKGGGGSDFTPAFTRLDEEGYDGAVIAFTDGMITVPTTQPVGLKGCLWVLEDGEKPPTEAWGDTLWIPTKEDEELPNVPMGGDDDDDDDDADEDA
jgi:predicted metal-dependent peptidase